MTDDESKVYRALENKQVLASSDIAKITGFGKNKSIIILKKLVDKGYLKVTGSGRGTKYFI